MSPRPFDDIARAQTAEWLESWSHNGRVLEARRISELRELTDEASAQIAVDLIWPMAPEESGDRGEGLRTIRRALQQLAGRR